MPEHLELPEPVALADRRQSGSFGASERRDPSSHGGALRGQLEAARIAPLRRVVEGVDPRRVFKIRASTRLTDAELAARQLQFLGDTPDWTYFVVPDDGDAAELMRAIDAYAAGGATDVTAPLAGFFDRVGEIAPYGPDDRISLSVARAIAEGDWPIAVDIVVWPSRNQTEATSRVGDVRRALDQFGGLVRGTDARPLTTVVRAECGEEALEAVASLMVVEALRQPMAPLVEPSAWLQAQIEDFIVPPAIDGAVVGVLDDGVAMDHPLLSDLVIAAYDFPDQYTWGPIGPHGTMVAALAAYGGFEDVLSRGEPTLPAPTRLVIARILEPVPNGSPSDTHFPSDEPEHEVVEEAIRRLHREHGVRVFNLSVTDRFAYSGPHAAVLTETLDRLVRELGIVVVVAAGNRPLPLGGSSESGLHALHDYPAYLHEETARLAEPAPAAIVLTVGSLAFSDAPVTAHGTTHVDRHVVAGRNRPSPFSRTGPGVVSQTKPDLVHFGGDLVWTGASLDSNDVGVGSISLNHDFNKSLFRVASGTSFAAPRVANLASRIAARYPDGSANLIRVLIAVACRYPEEADFDFSEEAMARTMGVGIPDAVNAEESSANRVVMTFDGEIQCDSALIHPVPIPEAFARGRADRTIAIGLAYDPPVRRQRREYLAGRIKLDLFRNIDLDQLRELMGRQNPDDRQELPGDRRRIQQRLRPTGNLVLGSTLQVRRWEVPGARSLDPDDGDTYHVVLTHVREPWADRLADEYTTQGYAVAVELWDRDRVDVDLYNLVQSQVRVPARLRVRA
jgi:hypothetical protein